MAGLLLAICGWVASAGTGVETDIRDLAPPNLKALDDLNELENETGISGDVNVTIRAQDPTSPAVISWARGSSSACSPATGSPVTHRAAPTPRSARLSP